MLFRSQLGLNFDKQVSDGGMRATAATKAARVHAESGVAQRAAGEAAYELKDQFNSRLGKVGPAPIDKPALKEARFGSGGAAEPAANFPGAIKPPEPPGFPPGYVPGSGANEIPKR